MCIICSVARSSFFLTSFVFFRCKLKCYEKIPEVQRIAIFTKFRGQTTKNEQDSYLQGMISAVEVKNRRRRKSEECSTKPNRGSSYIYEISTASGKSRVCKKAFVNIHGITNDRVRRLTILLRQGKAPIDQRGKFVPGNAKSIAVTDLVKQHISSFPFKISHYSSKEYHYLSEKLNVTEMHKLYTEKFPDVPVNYKFYLKIFRENFSLTFGRPQVDTCCTCEELQVKIKSKFLNDNAKRVYAAEKIVHIRRSNKFFSKMKEIKSLTQADDTVGAICIDFMQNLQLPSIPVQETFYLRQLTVSIFCIHNLKDSTADFYVYHEGIAGKGPNEVASFILDYIHRKMTGIEHLHIFSDGCSGQNKNHVLIRLFSALVSLNKFKTIEQYFPVRGHSFLPCDRNFAVLKRKLRRFDRVYTLKEYVELIITSTNKRNFTVVMVDMNDIFDFKKWWPHFYKKNMLSVESGGKAVPRDKKISLKISQYMHFKHSFQNEGVLVAKSFIDGLTCDTFRLRNTSTNPLTLPVRKAYVGKIPINKKKMNDLVKLKQYLPEREDVLEFYEDIYNWPTADKDNDVEFSD